APAAACLVRPALLRHPGHRRAAGGDAVAAGARLAPAPLPRMAGRAAAADGTGDAAVPHRGRRLRPALGDPADRPPVRRGPVRAAPCAQDRAQRAVLAGLRGPAARPLATRVARAHRGALGAGGHGAAGAGLLRQQGGAGAGPAPGLAWIGATAIVALTTIARGSKIAP